MSATPLAMQSFHNKNIHTSPYGGSPGSLNMKSSTGGSPYLPGYLLGNSPQVGTQSRALSSSGQVSSSMQTKWNSRSPPRQGLPYASPSERRTLRMSPQRTSPLSNMHSSLKDKPGAPPTEGLFSPIKSHEFMMMETESTMKPNNGIFQTSTNHLMSPQYNNSPAEDLKGLHKNKFYQKENLVPQSPAQVDPFYSQGESISCNDALDDTAVTVFGFPPAASTYILQQFAQYGSIVKYEMHQAGNWLHIKYQTKIQAKKALSRNGKIFSATIMVGVLPCIKKEIAEMESNANLTIPNNVPTPNKRPPSIRSLSNAAGVGGGGTPIRNLSASGITSTEKGTPQKQNSVVTKALDYVFGW